MSLTKKEIRDLSAMQICIKLTRFQFDEEADGITGNDKKEAMMLEEELRKKLTQALIGG